MSTDAFVVVVVFGVAWVGMVIQTYKLLKQELEKK